MARGSLGRGPLGHREHHLLRRPTTAPESGRRTALNPIAYTLDLLLPVVDLGQKHTYDPSGIGQSLSYLLIAAGWILVTTIATGVARALRRN